MPFTTVERDSRPSNWYVLTVFGVQLSLMGFMELTGPVVCMMLGASMQDYQRIEHHRGGVELQTIPAALREIVGILLVGVALIFVSLVLARGSNRARPLIAPRIWRRIVCFLALLTMSLFGLSIWAMLGVGRGWVHTVTVRSADDIALRYVAGCLAQNNEVVLPLMSDRMRTRVAAKEGVRVARRTGDKSVVPKPGRIVNHYLTVLQTRNRIVCVVDANGMRGPVQYLVTCVYDNHRTVVDEVNVHGAR